MSKITKIAALGGVALLAACTTAEEAETLSQKLSAAAIYAPVIADGETSITTSSG